MPELFLKPNDQPTLPQPQISVRAINDLLRAVPRVITGDGVQMKRIGDRYIIENDQLLNQPAQQVQHFVVMEEEDDYLVCVHFDFSNTEQTYTEDLGVSLQALGETGTVVNVAKPYWLRKTPFDGKIVTLSGVDVLLTYTGVGARTYDPASGATQLQVIQTPYFAGDIITAYEAASGITVDDTLIVWTDLNTASRSWIDSSASALRFVMTTSAGFVVPAESLSVNVYLTAEPDPFWYALGATVLIRYNSKWLWGWIGAIPSNTNIQVFPTRLEGIAIGDTMDAGATVCLTGDLKPFVLTNTNAAAPALNIWTSTLNIPNAGVNQTGVITDAAQSIEGVKTFTGDGSTASIVTYKGKSIGAFEFANAADTNRFTSDAEIYTSTPPAWSGVINYPINYEVSHGGYLWISTVANIGITPGVGVPEWSVYSADDLVYGFAVAAPSSAYRFGIRSKLGGVPLGSSVYWFVLELEHPNVYTTYMGGIAFRSSDLYGNVEYVYGKSGNYSGFEFYGGVLVGGSFTGLTSWTGSTSVTTLGTITTGVWQGTAVADTYIASAVAWNAKLDAMDPSWAGSTSITTLGTIATGTWEGSPIGDGYISGASTWNSALQPADIGVSVQAYAAALDAVSGTNTGDQDDSTVSYTATTSGDWNGAAPTTVRDALDRCAALLKTLNGGTGP